MCIDYRKLNKYTHKIVFLVPHADMHLDKLSGALVYLAIDIALVYHHFGSTYLIDTQKTACKT
jgi:hypothetical protein